MKNTTVFKLIDDYLSDYIPIAVDALKLNDDDGRDWLKDKTFIELISNDLDDKGFSKSEIDEILFRELSTNTAYKIVAYCLSLYDDYKTIDELKDIIQDYYSITTDEFTDEDLELIIKCAQKLD